MTQVPTSSNSTGSDNNCAQEYSSSKLMTFGDMYECTDKCLGSGAEGCVKTCIGKRSGREYAVKIVPKTTDNTRSLILNEMKVLNLGRTHVNIVELLDAYEEKDCFRLVFEKLDSMTLADHVIKFGPFCEEDASVITGDVASALHFLHKHGVVHRDVKLHNILASEDTFFPVKLCDFGYSFCPDSFTSQGSELLKTAVGTLEYFAPEMARLFLNEKIQYSSKCDMWSLGVTLFACLSGEKPVRTYGDVCYCRGRIGMCEYCEDDALECIKEGVYEMSETWMHVSDEAMDLVSKLLEVDPEKRLSASEVLDHPWIKRYNPDL